MLRSAIELEQMQLIKYQLAPGINKHPELVCVNFTKKKRRNKFEEEKVFFQNMENGLTFGEWLITLGASGWPAISAIAEKCSFGSLNISQTIFCFSPNVVRIDSSMRLSRSIDLKKTEDFSIKILKKIITLIYFTIQC